MPLATNGSYSHTNRMRRKQGSSQNLRGFVNWAAQVYGINPKFLSQIANLESSWRPGVMNDWDSNAAKGTPSYGLFQFIEPTFEAFSWKAKKANPNAWRGINMNWKDPKAQALTAAWAFANGLGSHWATNDDALLKFGLKGPKINPGMGYGGAGGLGGGAQTFMGKVRTPGQTTMEGGFWSGGPDNDYLKRAQKVFWNNPSFLNMVTQKHISNNQPQWNAPKFSQGPGGTMPALMQTGMKPSAGGSLPAGDWLGYKPKGNDPWSRLNDLARYFNAGITSGKRPGSGSWHNSGRALDFGDSVNSRETFNKIAAWAKANHSWIKEMYFNPLGWHIENGRIMKGPGAPGHNDHLHLAM